MFNANDATGVHDHAYEQASLENDAREADAFLDRVRSFGSVRDRLDARLVATSTDPWLTPGMEWGDVPF